MPAPWHNNCCLPWHGGRALTGKIAIISEHASPLACAGGVDSGGQNIYVAQVARHLARLGFSVDVFTRRDSQNAARRGADRTAPARGARARGAGDIRSQGRSAAADGQLLRLRARVRAGRSTTGWCTPTSSCPRSSQRSSSRSSACRSSSPSMRSAACVGCTRARRTSSRPSASTSRTRCIAQADAVDRRVPAGRGRSHPLYGADPAAHPRHPLRLRPGGVLAHRACRSRARALGFDPNERIVLQLGRLVPRKGVDNVIRALGRLARSHGIAARLVVVGGDSDVPDPIAHARDRSAARSRGGRGRGRPGHLHRAPQPRVPQAATTTPPTSS